MSDDRAQPQTHRQIADIKSASAEPEQAQAPPQAGADLLKYVLDVAPDGFTVLDRDLNVIETRPSLR